MKQILTFLFLVFSLASFGQQDSTWYDGTVIPMSGKHYQFKFLKVDSGQNVIGPSHLRDSTFSYFTPAEDDSSHLVPNTAWVKRRTGGNDSAYVNLTTSPDSTEIWARRNNGGVDTLVLLGETISGADLVEINNTLDEKLDKSDTASLSNRINQKVNISDTATMLSPYLTGVDTVSLSNRIDAAGGGSGPLRYKILLTNSGGTFTVKSLENSLGDGSGNGTTDIAWTNPSNGVLRATMTGAFTADKTFPHHFSINGGGQSYIVTAERLSANILDFNVVLHDGTQSSTPNFTDQPILIEVYP